MKKLISFFAHRPLYANILMFGLVISSVFFWFRIGKEEMPEFTFNSIRVSISYPGAAAEDVEHFIIRPVEEELKGLSGLDEVTATGSYGSATFSISFEPTVENLAEKVQEVKDAVEKVDLPNDVEQPVYRQFKTSEKAIIDIGLFLKDTEIHTVKSRALLQKHALAIKNRLINLPEISNVDESGYREPEIHIKILPNKLKELEISLSEVKQQISKQHIRSPIGSMEDKSETEITLKAELDTVEDLENVIISNSFSAKKIYLKEVATIERAFAKSNSITKIQGREGIKLNVKKSNSSDIISAQKAIVKFLSTYKKQNPKSPVGLVLIDDESYDVRNRLELIGANGIIGFILIVIILFIFLDFRAGVWVGMGIPFSLSFTLISCYLMGYTINNMTLAAIIIVLGIVVDDAIIVAENISREEHHGNSPGKSAVEGTTRVILPIIASVLTTCAAFVPLYFFEGRFSLFVKYIPAVIFLMLFASLIESSFILPSHMIHKLPGEDLYKKFFKKNYVSIFREKYIHVLEIKFERVLLKLLPWRTLIFGVFALMLALSGYLYKEKLRYVMFPREESRDFTLKVIASDNLKRLEMAKKVSEIEKLILEDPYKIVTSIRTTIGQSRRGGEVKENEATLRVEIVPPSEREISLNKYLKELKIKTDKLKGYKEVRALKSRFGSGSGSPIAIQVQENDDTLRNQVLNELREKLTKIDYLSNVEIERPLLKDEYLMIPKKDAITQLNVDFEQLSSSLRAYIQGSTLYTLRKGDEEIDVKLTTQEDNKRDIETILDLKISNSGNYLVPLRELVDAVKGKKPSNIQRTNFKRANFIYADIADGKKITPLEIADLLEEEVFPSVLEHSPSTILRFRGEIEDSREAQSDFGISVLLVLGLIYVLLIFLFNSMLTPLLIGTIIPFGVVGVIFSFYAHGMMQFGFFAVVGTLGMIGIVINDSIVLIDKLEEKFEATDSKKNLFEQIARISSTRLRAVVVTTLTTVTGLFPTAYGLGGYDSMLAEMMLAMAWGLLFAMFITLLLVPCLYSYFIQLRMLWKKI